MAVAARILKALTAFQRRNRFVATVQESRLSLSATHIMVELDLTPGASAGEVARRLCVERSTVVRALAELSSRRLVRVDKLQGGRRRAFLTAAGARLLAKADRAATERIAQFAASLANDQIKELGRLLDRLGEGLGAPPATLRSADHPLRAALRRCTRGAGILSDNFLGMGIGSTNWQILCVVLEGECRLIGDLARVLGLAPSTASLMVGALRRKGLIEFTPAAYDGRKKVISLSEAGAAYIGDIQRDGEERITEALSRTKEQRIDMSMALTAFESFAALEAKVQLEANEVIAYDDDPRFRAEARGWLLRNVVAQRLEERSPAIILADDWWCGVRRRGEWQGVTALGWITEKRAALSILFVAADGDNRRMRRCLIAGLCERLERLVPGWVLEINPAEIFFDTDASRDGLKQTTIGNDTWRAVVSAL